MEKDFNIIISCDAENKCFIVLTEGGKVSLSTKKLRSAVTSARRSYIISGMVKLADLSEEDRKRHDHNMMKSASIIATGQIKAGKNLLPEM